MTFLHHARLRAGFVALLAGALVLPIGGVVAPDADAAPDKSTLAALKAKADRARDQMLAGTKALEAGQRHLVQVRSKADRATRELGAVRTKLDASKKELAEYAASVYRNPVPGTVALFISGEQGDAKDKLQALANLRMVNSEKTAALHSVTLDRRRADQLNREASQLAAEAAAQEKALAAQVKRLQAQAATAADELAAAVKAYEEEQERLERERARKEAERREAERRAAEARAAKERAAQQRAAQQRSAQGQASRSRPAAASSTCAGAGNFASGSRSWGGYPNGLIPSSALCNLAGAPRHKLRADAAVAFDKMSAAYAQAFGGPICVTDSYRSYSEQVDVYRRKPTLAAVPGTSNHGWGLAVDLCGGIQNFGSATHRWMKAHAPRFGWYHPGWAEPRGSKPEPWHWEFGRIS